MVSDSSFCSLAIASCRFFTSCRAALSSSSRPSLFPRASVKLFCISASRCSSSAFSPSRPFPYDSDASARATRVSTSARFPSRSPSEALVSAREVARADSSPAIWSSTSCRRISSAACALSAASTCSRISSVCAYAASDSRVARASSPLRCPICPEESFLATWLARAAPAKVAMAEARECFTPRSSSISASAFSRLFSARHRADICPSRRIRVAERSVTSLRRLVSSLLDLAFQNRFFSRLALSALLVARKSLSKLSREIVASRRDWVRLATLAASPCDLADSCESSSLPTTWSRCISALATSSSRMRSFLLKRSVCRKTLDLTSSLSLSWWISVSFWRCEMRVSRRGMRTCAASFASRSVSISSLAAASSLVSCSILATSGSLASCRPRATASASSNLRSLASRATRQSTSWVCSSVRCSTSATYFSWRCPPLFFPSSTVCESVITCSSSACRCASSLACCSVTRKSATCTRPASSPATWSLSVAALSSCRCTSTVLMSCRKSLLKCDVRLRSAIAMKLHHTLLTSATRFSWDTCANVSLRKSWKPTVYT
mmetsp:Transcript_48723/g.156005  ORF Transcript_48723/g.156005 Transcript_48723/m.156005 type:complete len:551 (-) Transcript_48723:348-2000(-)